LVALASPVGTALRIVRELTRAVGERWTLLYTGDFGDMERFAGVFPAVKLFGLRP
jgi:hypothetical protein